MTEPVLDQLNIETLSRSEKMELTVLLEESARRKDGQGILHINVGPTETKAQALTRVLEEQGLTEAGTRHWFKFYFIAPRPRS